MQQIRLYEPTAELRRIPLPRCVQDADGVTEMTGLSFAVSDIKISKNGGAEGNSTGSVVEVASGYYYYVAAQAELDTEGYLMIRLAKTNVRINVAIVQVGSTTFKRNKAFSNFCFKLVLASDHISPAVGITVVAQRSIDGAAFAGCANAVSEIGSGWYKITLAAADLNGDVIALKFTEGTIDQRDFLLTTT